jgi:hypothetical protein
MKNNSPRIGDLVRCADGDVGVVLDCWDDEREEMFKVKIAWNSGPTYVDHWPPMEYPGETGMFFIMSRACLK